MPSVPEEPPPANVVTCHALGLGGGVGSSSPLFEEPPPQVVSSSAAGNRNNRNKIFLSDRRLAAIFSGGGKFISHELFSLLYSYVALYNLIIARNSGFVKNISYILYPVWRDMGQLKLQSVKLQSKAFGFRKVEYSTLAFYNSTKFKQLMIYIVHR